MERIFPGTTQVEVTVRIGEVYRHPETDDKVEVVQIITPPNHPWDTLFRDSTDTEGDNLGADDEVTEPVRIRYRVTTTKDRAWLSGEFTSPIEHFIQMYVVNRPL